LSEHAERTRWTERTRRALWLRMRFLRLLGIASPPLVAAAVISATVAGLLPTALLIAGGVLSARIQEALAAEGADGSMRSVYGAFALLMALFLVSEVMVPIQSRLRWLVLKRVDGAARDRAMRATLRGTDMTRLHDEQFLAAMRRVHGLVHYSATPGGGAAGMIGLLRDYLSGFSAAAVMALYQPWVAAVVLAAALVVRFQWRAQVIVLINTWIAGGPFFAEARYFSELGLGRRSAHEIRLFGLTDWIRQRVRGAGIGGWTPTWDRRIYALARPAAVHLVLSTGVAVMALIWAARAATSGELDLGELVVFVPALFAVLALGRTFDDDLAVEYGGVMLPALHTIDRLATNAAARETGRTSPGRNVPPTIELRDVSFRYPGAEQDVLRRVRLSIPAGTSAALVGMNGAGKTTLVRLLCGLYAPRQGRVLVDGVDVGELDLDEWHRCIAPMFQDFLRLQVSVTENVEAGAVEHMGDVDAARWALAEANALGFAGRLPRGVDSLLATRYADGTDLSGGQWQRLGVARALFAMRAGARFLILDEPTSNLDTSSEERLVRRLLDDTRGTVTALLVTHRLALARRTDRIFVVERGLVVEHGTHDELLSIGGRYAAAFSMQASLYPLDQTADG
jgi:ATP-binding cassette subfamily B protein